MMEEVWVRGKRLECNEEEVVGKGVDGGEEEAGNSTGVVKTDCG